MLYNVLISGFKCVWVDRAMPLVFPTVSSLYAKSPGFSFIFNKQTLERYRFSDQAQSSRQCQVNIFPQNVKLCYIISMSLFVFCIVLPYLVYLCFPVC